MNILLDFFLKKGLVREYQKTKGILYGTYLQFSIGI